MTKMKALTIQQPWAWAIAAGHKRVENRQVRTHYRGPLAIHAGKSEAWLDSGLDFLDSHNIIPLQDLVFGAVIAVADLVDCVEFDETRGLLPADPRLQTPFASGPFCYVLENIRPLVQPIPWKGQQGWFSVEIPSQ